MNTNRFLLAVVVVYVVYQALGFLVHGVWLDSTYESLASVFRPRAEMDAMMWVFFSTSFVMVFMFCFIFTLGYQNRGVAEGVRYGIYMGLFLAVVQSFDAWAIYPIPLGLALNWFLSGMGIFIVMGIVLALIYKPKTA